MSETTRAAVDVPDNPLTGDWLELSGRYGRELMYRSSGGRVRVCVLRPRGSVLLVQIYAYDADAGRRDTIPLENWRSLANRAVAAGRDETVADSINGVRL